MAADDLFAQLPIPQVTPEALGVPPLGPPPTPPQVPAARQMNPWVRTVMGALAAGLGPGAGTGLLQGANVAGQQQEQQRQQAFHNAQQLYDEQRRNWEVQDRLTQQEADRRQALYQNSIADLRTKATSGQLANRDDYDRFMEAYAAGLQQQGLRGVNANTLRSAVPYLSPDVSKVIYQKLDQLFKDPEQRKLLQGNPQAGEGLISYVDPGDKLTHQITLSKAIALANFPALLSPDGSLMPMGTKPLTPTEAAGKAGVFQRTKDALIASGVKPESADAQAAKVADDWEVQQKVNERVAMKKAGVLPGEQNAPPIDDVKAIADAIQKGDDAPDLARMYGKAAAVRAELDRRGVPIKKLQLEWQAAQAFTRSLNGQQMVRFKGLASSVVNTIDEVRALGEQLQQGNVQLWNRATRNTIQQLYGNTPQSELAARYVSAINTLKEEFAGLVQGGYAPTEAAFRLANQQVNGDYGVKDLSASLSEAQRLINYRMNGFQNLQPTVPGGVETSPSAAPSTPTAPPTTTSGPTVGERRLFNGQLGEWDGKGWKAVH